MLCLQVWLTPTYTVARDNCINSRCDSVVCFVLLLCFVVLPPSSTSAIQTTFRLITYHTGCTWSQRCVPACFIAVLFDSRVALIGQWSPQTILSRPQDGPFCLQLHSSSKFDAVTCCACWCETCLPVLHCRSRTSRITNPEGDVYEVRDRFEGGCRGSRGRAR